MSNHAADSFFVNADSDRNCLKISIFASFIFEKSGNGSFFCSTGSSGRTIGSFLLRVRFIGFSTGGDMTIGCSSGRIILSSTGSFFLRVRLTDSLGGTSFSSMGFFSSLWYSS